VWAPISVGLLIATVAQATSGAVGLAIAYGVLLLIVLGLVVLRRRSATRPSATGDGTGTTSNAIASH
jgi:hypothetical protein